MNPTFKINPGIYFISDINAKSMYNPDKHNVLGLLIKTDKDIKEIISLETTRVDWRFLTPVDFDLAEHLNILVNNRNKKY